LTSIYDKLILLNLFVMAKKNKKEEIEKNVENEILNNEGVEVNPEEKVTESKNNEQNKGADTETITEEQSINYEQKYKELNDKYLRLTAEFDNFRKRSLKEKMDLIKTAGEDILINILPVVDNFERALKSINNNTSEEGKAISEGIELIYSKFKEFLSQRGVKEIDASGKAFDTDLHEAITKIPAPQEDMKGKVIDVIEKGYLMHEKVIRFSKVVIGE
jgi:molecular chaperone GrpE